MNTGLTWQVTENTTKKRIVFLNKTIEALFKMKKTLYISLLKCPFHPDVSNTFSGPSLNVLILLTEEALKKTHSMIFIIK